MEKDPLIYAYIPHHRLPAPPPGVKLHQVPLLNRYTILLRSLRPRRGRTHKAYIGAASLGP